MVAELPVVLEVLSDGLENFFFGEEGDNFFFWLLQHPHFVRETNNQHQHFFPRCSSDGSTPESRMMQVKEKQKYRPQNVIRFHLQGCCCVLKRPPTLPTSKDSHCNDKRFGNLPPSFRSLAFYFGSISRAWHCKSGEMVQKFSGIPVKARKRKYLERYYLFSENFPPG